MHEGMAILPGGGAAGRGANMGEKQAGAHLARQALQIAVRPGGQDVAVMARLGLFAIPGQAKAIAMRRLCALREARDWTMREWEGSVSRVSRNTGFPR